MRHGRAAPSSLGPSRGKPGWLNLIPSLCSGFSLLIGSRARVDCEAN
ncbi:hypothetical protein [Lysobacter gummosus]